MLDTPVFLDFLPAAYISAGLVAGVVFGYILGRSRSNGCDKFTQGDDLRMTMQGRQLAGMPKQLRL